MNVEVGPDGNIREIVIKGYKFQVRPIPPEDAGKIIETFKIVEDVLKSVTLKFEDDEWDENTFKEFVNELTDHQRVFLIKCANDWTSTKEILAELKNAGLSSEKPQVVSGLRSGITKKLKKVGKKEDIVDKNWNNKEGQNYYRVKPKYRKLVEKFLIEGGDKF